MSSLHDIQVSKNLSWLLRHGALKEGLPIATNGFIELDCVLNHKNFRGRYTADDIMRVVQTDAKNRYTVTTSPETNKLMIKANQGHSINEVNELNLTKIRTTSEVSLVVHGTFYRHLPLIRRQGLKKMNRNHIHFSMSDKVNSRDEKVSGIRHNCEVLIYINIDLALRSGIEFFRSENNVILSSGVNGIIKPEFFQKIIDRKTGKPL